MDAMEKRRVADAGLTMVRRSNRTPVVVQLTVFFALAMVVSAAVLSGVGYFFMRDMLLDQIRDRLDVAVTAHRAALLGLVQRRRELVRRLAEPPGLPDLLQRRSRGELAGDGFRNEAKRLLEDAKSGAVDVAFFSLTDPAGRVIAGTEGGDADRSLFDDPDFLLGLAEAHVGVPRAVPGGYRMNAAAPILGADGRLAGAVWAEIDAGPVAAMLSDRRGLGHTGEVLLAARTADVVRFIPLPRQSDGTSVIPLSRLGSLAEAIQGREGFSRMTDPSGVEVLAAYRPVGYRDWGLVAKIDASEACEPGARLRNLLAGLVLGVLAFGLAGAWILARRFTQPILRMADTAARIATGDLAARVTVRSGDELGILGAAFNRMTESLVAEKVSLERRVEDRTRELAMRERQLRQILDTAHESFIAMNADGEVIEWNPEAERTFGWTRDEARGRTVAELLIPPEMREAHARGLPRYLSTGEGPVPGRRIELTAIHRDGRRLPVEMTVSPLRWEGGVQFNVFLRDVTERKRLEETLRAGRRELQEYVDEMSTFNAKLSPDGRFLLVNRAAQTASGYAPDELMKVNFLDGPWWSFDAGVQARVRDAFRRAVAGTPVGYEERIRVADGRILDIAFSLVPVANAAGTTDHVIAEGRDVSALKQAEAGLERKTRELARSNLELEQFAHVASHDLKEPVRKILLFGDRLREKVEAGVDEEGRGDYDRLLAAADRMRRLIDDLLQLSRASTTLQSLERVELAEVLADVTSDLEPMIRESGAAVETGPLPAVRADAVQMRQLFQNLVGNALKYRPAGRPPRIRISGGRNGDGSEAVTVEDDGIGFDPKFAEEIFRPFFRLHARNEYEGTGMGLAICKRIVERHGGTIHARAEPGKGCVFTVHLPPA